MPNISEATIHIIDFGELNLVTSCVCATDPYCQAPLGLYDDHEENRSQYIFDYYALAYNIPGSVVGCFNFDSLRSTFECFYEDSNCWPILFSRINTIWLNAESDIPWVNIEPLHYDLNSSRFLRNTSILAIVKELMIEKWNWSSSYGSYYQTCAPIYCTYSDIAKTDTFGAVLVRLISTLGGLVVILRLITPELVKSVSRLFMSNIQSQQRGNPLSDIA